MYQFTPRLTFTNILETNKPRAVAWVTGKGEYLKDGSWVSPDGNNFYCNMAASVFEAIIH